MEDTVYVLVFDGFADWEPALATCEIRKGGYRVATVGFTEDPVVSMGGLTIVPDVSIDEVDWSTAALFILPGGDMWEEYREEAFFGLLRRLDETGLPIAAICGATIAAAHAGLLDHRRHTSNVKEYLQAHAPAYEGAAHYTDELAVTDGTVITANGVGSVEFAREIIKLLEIYDEENRQMWYGLFKHGEWTGMPTSHEATSHPSAA